MKKYIRTLKGIYEVFEYIEEHNCYRIRCDKSGDDVAFINENQVIKESDDFKDLIDFYYYELAHCYHQPEFKMAYIVNPVFDLFVEQLKSNLKNGVIVNFKAMIWVGDDKEHLNDLHTAAVLNDEYKLELIINDVQDYK